MKAQLLDIQKHPSKYEGDFYYLFFKDENGKNYKSCVGDAFRNWKNWSDIIANFDKSNPIWLDGLKLKGELIDADSKPIRISIDD